MEHGVTVQWCPSCSAWTKSKSVSQELVKASDLGEAFSAVGDDFFRKSHECMKCGEGFVTIKLANLRSDEPWKIAGELSKIRQSDVFAISAAKKAVGAEEWVI